MGRRVLITGGVQGIGRSIAEAFQQAGDQVTVTGLTESEIEAFEVSGIEVMPLDVTRSDDVRAAVERFERLDVLVNCAGTILRDGAEHSEEGFEKVINVNLSGVMRLCYGAHALLAHSQGCVLNVASMLSFFWEWICPGLQCEQGRDRAVNQIAGDCLGW